MRKRSSIDTSEYRAEREKWYGKLEKKGFRDIEMIDRRTGAPGNYLHGVSAGDLRRNSRRIQNVRETRAFYEAARGLVHDEKFWPRKIDARIWEMYAEGAKQRDILEMLSRYTHPSRLPYATPGHMKRVIERGRAEVLRRAQGEDLEGLE